MRSALLYADSVELLSPVASLIASIAMMNQAGAEGYLAMLASLDNDLLTQLGLEMDPVEFKDFHSKYQAFAGMSRAERRRAPELEATRREVLRSFDASMGGLGGARDQVTNLVVQSGAPELAEAVASGALTINWDFMPADGDTDTLVDNYANHLQTLLASPDVHLLLDDSTGRMAAAMIREGMVSPPDLTMSRATRSQVGTGLVARLPAFPNASVASILEARSELSEPLARYRAGVTGVGARIRSATFEPGVDAEVTDIWRDEVQPAVRQLERDLSRTRLVRETTRNTVGNAMPLLGGGSLFVGMQTYTNLHSLAAACVAATPIVGPAVVAALRESEHRRRNARQHELFYLLELDRRL